MHMMVAKNSVIHCDLGEVSGVGWHGLSIRR